MINDIQIDRNIKKRTCKLISILFNTAKFIVKHSSQNYTRNIHKKFYFLIILFVIFSFNRTQTLANNLIFYYNPNNNITNPISFIRTAGKFFKKNNLKKYNFQPIATVQILEEKISSEKPKFGIFSSLYFTELEKKFNIKPILISIDEYDNNVTFKKILITQKGNRLTSLRNEKIALTSIGNKDLKKYNQFLNKGHKFEIDGNPIWVKKDMDAVLAVNFKQVDAAFVNETTYNYLKKKSPFSIKNVTVVNNTYLKIPTAILVRFIDYTNGDDEKTIKNIFTERLSKNNQLGKQLLEVLKTEEWQVITKKKFLNLLNQ